MRACGVATRRWRAPAAAVAVVLALSLALTGSGGPARAIAATPQRASLTAIENDVMCVACHESLAVAQSPEAFSEREYIRGLIAQGETRRQIEDNLVQQYGPSVLALPPAHGFNLLVYVVPPVLVILGITMLVITIPRWRRRARLAAAEPAPPASPLDPADASRLDEDLARQS
ncbi:MAG: cytochrome c-type biogenesis protein CcmH [Solirubrobacteraceae bacterium]